MKNAQLAAIVFENAEADRWPERYVHGAFERIMPQS